MIEIKPCPSPWCEALERDGDYSPVARLHHFGNYRVVCTSCVLEGPLCQSEAEAIAAWNTRTPDPSLIAGLREAREALAESREALHFHYVEWDGEPEDAVPLQLARSQCDAAIARLDNLLSQEGQP